MILVMAVFFGAIFIYWVAGRMDRVTSKGQ